MATELQSALKNVLIELGISLIHGYGLISALRFHNSRDLKLHIGCGMKIKAGWVNADIYKGADLVIDLRKRLPFKDGSCAIIYAEHFLEHLAYPKQASFFLAEACRVLKPGGTISLGVPDAELPVRAYVEGNKADYFQIAKQSYHPKWCDTKMEHINYHFRDNGGHLFAYDEETLCLILTKHGFVQAGRRDFDPGLDSAERKFGTLYVQAIKPGTVK